MSELGSSLTLVVCASHELVDGGAGVRFDLPGSDSDAVAAFVVRYDGVARAFLNQCAHIPVELDWKPGDFFDSERQFLICATHGATYRPEDGRCVEGPCRGKSLIVLECHEHDGKVWARISSW